MRLSSYNPILFFAFDTGETHSGNSGYIQVFAETDHIMLEIFHGIEENPEPIVVYSVENEEIIRTLTWKRFFINSNNICSVCKFSGLPIGEYMLIFGSYRSFIQILGTDDLDDTVLIQYANPDNNVRNDLFSNFMSNILFFELRIRGGFKDSGWIFQVENSQFMSPQNDIVELYATDYTDKVLTIGTSSGIPSSIAELINLIFTCQLIFVDGIRFARSGEKLLESKKDLMFQNQVYTITLRESQFLNAKFERMIRISLRKVPERLRKVNNYLRKL